MNYRTKRIIKNFRAIEPVNYMLVRAGRFVIDHSQTLPDVLAKYLPPVGPIETALPNGYSLKLWSEASADGDDQIARYIFWKGWLGIQPSTTKVFWDLAQNADVILDIGAHVGFYALLGALAKRNSAVYAFEPLPIAYARLKKNIELNQLQDRINALPLAAGQHSGLTKFFHLSEGFPSSSSLSSGFMQGSPERSLVTSSTVEVVRIDDFIHDHELQHVSLVKMDTETTEPEILAGMVQTIQRDRPFIICEVMNGYGVEPRLEAILKPLGYRYFAISTTGPIAVDRIISLNSRDFSDGRDYLFAPAESDFTLHLMKTHDTNELDASPSHLMGSDVPAGDQ